jgi:hypothetical protein
MLYAFESASQFTETAVARLIAEAVHLLVRLSRGTDRVRRVVGTGAVQRARLDGDQQRAFPQGPPVAWPCRPHRTPRGFVTG